MFVGRSKRQKVAVLITNWPFCGKNTPVLNSLTVAFWHWRCFSISSSFLFPPVSAANPFSTWSCTSSAAKSFRNARRSSGITFTKRPFLSRTVLLVAAGVASKAWLPQPTPRSVPRPARQARRAPFAPSPAGTRAPASRPRKGATPGSWLLPPMHRCASRCHKVSCKNNTPFVPTWASAMSCGRWQTSMPTKVNAKVIIDKRKTSSQQPINSLCIFRISAFIIKLDQSCGPLTLHSSLKDLVKYTRDGLEYLSKETSSSSGGNPNTSRASGHIASTAPL